MVLRRLPNYTTSGMKYSMQLADGGDRADIDVFLDLSESGTQDFFANVYEEMFTAPLEPFQATVRVHPASITRLSPLRALSSDLQAGLHTPTLTTGYACELLAATARVTDAETVATLTKRLIDADIVGEKPLTHAYTYLDDLGVDTDQIRNRVETGTDLPSVLANAVDWRFLLARDIVDVPEMENRTVFVNGMRVQPVTSERIREVTQATQSVTDLQETLDEEAVS